MSALFAFRNEYSQNFSLTDSVAHYMPDISGLGYTMDADYSRIGHTWVNNYFVDAQSEMDGTVIFSSEDPFASFASMMSFIRQAKSLYFVYTNSQGEYIRSVDVTMVENAGLVGKQTLKCEIKMVGKSLWYSPNVQNISISVDVSGNFKKYTWSYPTSYQPIVNGTMVVNNDGSVPAPFSVVWHGPIVNPVLTLLVDGTETARCEITAEALAGETIRYSSVDGDLYVCLEDDEGVRTNLVSGLNINLNNFFKLPIGTSELQFSADAQITEPVVISINKMYRAV